MKNFIKMLICALGSCVNVLALQAQSDSIYHAKANVWFFADPSFQLHERWSMGTELHLRREHWVLHNNSDLIRPYLNFHLNQSVVFTLGYTYLRTWPVEPLYGPGSSNEQNIWEQVTFKQELTGAFVSHRYRLEHRFADHWDLENGYYIKDGTDFANRFRYRLSVDFPLPVDPGKPQLSIKLFDEVWINQYNNMMFKSFARNWFYAGLSWEFTPHGSVELGYIHQFDRKNNSFLSTNIMQLALAYHWTQEIAPKLL